MSLTSFQLVGLAFERNLVLCHSEKKDSSAERESFENITFVDIVHYAFNYIGLLTGKEKLESFATVSTNSNGITFTGPYFRYRTFVDYFSLPFKNHANCVGETISKIKWIPLFAVVYLVVNYLWPLSVGRKKLFFH